MKKSKLLILIASVSSSSCISLTSFQTARTTKPGKANAFVALGSQGVRFAKKSSDKEEADQQNSLEKIRIPILEGGFRYGLATSIDMGARYALIPGTIGIDGKYALSGLSTPLAHAVGIGFDYSSFSSKTSSSSAKFSISDFSIPFYTSYDFGNASAVYFTPKLINRTTSASYSSDISNSNSSRSMALFGVSTGVRLENFVIEYSMASTFGGQSSSFLDQITIGFVMNTDHENHHSQYSKREAPMEGSYETTNGGSKEVEDVTLDSAPESKNSKQNSKKK